jgi:hypothetical protein
MDPVLAQLQQHLQLKHPQHPLLQNLLPHLNPLLLP